MLARVCCSLQPLAAAKVSHRMYSCLQAVPDVRDGHQQPAAACANTHLLHLRVACALPHQRAALLPAGCALCPKHALFRCNVAQMCACGAMCSTHQLCARRPVKAWPQIRCSIASQQPFLTSVNAPPPAGREAEGGKGLASEEAQQRLRIRLHATFKTLPIPVDTREGGGGRQGAGVGGGAAAAAQCARAGLPDPHRHAPLREQAVRRLSCFLAHTCKSLNSTRPPARRLSTMMHL